MTQVHRHGHLNQVLTLLFTFCPPPCSSLAALAAGSQAAWNNTDGASVKRTRCESCSKTAGWHETETSKQSRSRTQTGASLRWLTDSAWKKKKKKKVCPWPAVIHVFIFLFSNISITIDLRWLLWHSCQSQLVHRLDPSIDTDPGVGGVGGVRESVLTDLI